jgi:hypothetical protein
VASYPLHSLADPRGRRAFARPARAGLYVLQTSYFQQERQAGELVLDVRHASTDPKAGFNLGAGLQLYPGGKFVGIGAGLRSHYVIGQGDGFLTAELGVVLR